MIKDDSASYEELERLPFSRRQQYVGFCFYAQKEDAKKKRPGKQGKRYWIRNRTLYTGCSRPSSNNPLGPFLMDVDPDGNMESVYFLGQMGFAHVRASTAAQCHVLIRASRPTGRNRDSRSCQPQLTRKSRASSSEPNTFRFSRSLPFFTVRVMNSTVGSFAP